MLTIYFVGFILYCLSALLSYSNSFKSSSWFIPMGLFLAFLVNYMWLYIAKTTGDKHVLYLRGMYWDAMIMGCYILIPILCYGIKFKPMTAAGICLIVIGMILTKL